MSLPNESVPDRDCCARLEAGIQRANEMVIGASMAIMDANSSEVTVTQARYFQTLFSKVRDVLQESLREYCHPATAPDDWESFGSSRAALGLADALVGVSS